MVSLKKIDYARYLNYIALARQRSALQGLAEILAQNPKMISFANGVPNAETFPFHSAEVKLKDGRVLVLDKARMTQAFEAGVTRGDEAFLEQLKALHVRFHNPPTLNRDKADGGLSIQVTMGSQDGIAKALEMLITKGDYVLMDSPAYATTLAEIRPLGCRLLTVESDSDGMIPDSLRKTLSRWQPSESTEPNSTIPRILYTVPNGQNPTGASLTLARRKEIYQIAREHGLLILEDDPYFFLQYTETRLPSFLSMDEDGRVIRFDSFSKVISSGIRVGYVSGPDPLISRITMHMMCSILHVPSLTQVLISDMLKMMGPDGFEEHVIKIREFYRERKNAMMRAADKWLTGLAEWHEPKAGLFVWFKVKGVEDTKKLVGKKSLEKQVMVAPGCAFMHDSDAPCPYFRATFSIASPEEMDRGFQGLAEMIQEETQSS